MATLAPQGPYAKGLLNLCKTVLLKDKAYVERLKRHYNLFKEEAKKRDLTALINKKIPLGRNDPFFCEKKRWVYFPLTNTECVGWHVCKTGDRFAALEPIEQAVKTIYGSLEKGIASGVKLRIDNGCQYTSDYFLQQIAYWGVEVSFGLVKQPETNGVSERFHRTLKEQVIEGRIFRNIDEVRETVKQFIQV